MQGYSSLAAPLSSLTQKGVDFAKDWHSTHTEAFLALKELLCSAPVLRLPDFSVDFNIITDASLLGTGGILMQDGHVVAYTSSKFSPAERNYTTTEQELLGVIRALEEWRCYVEGKHVLIETDHNPLTHLDTQPTVSRRMARWVQFLQQFTYELKYKKGTNNVADPISRNPALSAPCLYLAVMSQESRSQAVNHAATASRRVKVTRLQARKPKPADTDFMSRIQAGYAVDDWFRTRRHLKKCTEVNGFWMQDGQILVPNVDTLRTDIIRSLHSPPTSGHIGRIRTIEIQRRSFRWNG
jgi:hypothetical protein